MNSSRLIIAIVATALAALIVWWFYRNLELVSKQARGAPSTEAIANPLLAAQRFLSKVGIPTQSRQGRKQLNVLPSQRDALVVYSFGDGLTPKKSQQLLNWVAAGGRLIFPARAFYDKDIGKSGNPLLDSLGVALKRKEVKAEALVKDFEHLSPEEIRKREEAMWLDVTNVQFANEPAVKVGFQRDRILEYPGGRATLSASGKAGEHLIQIQYGRGTVTVLSDMNFLDNPVGAIEKYDNAYCLYLLVHDAANVWLLYNPKYERLPVLLWRWAPAFCIAAFALLITWLWWLMDPFGPKRLLATDSRRNILEQLLAAANFEWSIDKGKRRVATNRKLILDELQRKHPAIRRMSGDETCTFLSKASGMKEADIALALFDDWRGEREFIQLSSNLQQLHEAL